MNGERGWIMVFASLVVGLLLMRATEVYAVPSFQRQTGRDCNACHTVFPDLTPFGRSFKLGGYILTKPGQPPSVPISATVQASFTDQKGLRGGINPYDDRPDARWNVPQEASVFYAGKIVDHFGAFSQLTYDGAGNGVSLDMTDLRYANSLKLAGSNLIYGATVNNSPTVQDVWNSTPVWRFPGATSPVAVTPTAAPLIEGLAQQVGGIGAYGFFHELIYAEVSVYRTNRKGITRLLGAGTTTDTVVDGAVPYWRLVVQKQWGAHSMAIGTFGLIADVFPSGSTSGPTDRFTDTAVDAQYQYITGKHVLSGQASFIREKQDWSASFPMGNTANSKDYLNAFRGNANYYYRSTIGTLGGTVGCFSMTGTKDEVLYAPSDVTGSRTGRPNSSGFILEADYLPWPKWKFGLQYTYYNTFNGAHTDYDGSGRNASDNNTLFFFVWGAF